MDLRFLRRPDLAESFVARYGGRAEDPELCALLPLYEAHRALVRAKVESLRAQEDEVADATWEVPLHQRGEFVPLRETTAERRISLDTGRPELDVATDVERAVERVR